MGRNRLFSILGIGGGFILLFVLRSFFPERSLYQTGPQALSDAFFALSLLGIMTLIACGAGLKIIRWLKLEGLGRLERAVFGVALGYGIVAYGVMALGLLGYLYSWAILSWLILLGVLTWREWSEIISKLGGWVREGSAKLKSLAIWKKIILGMIGLIFSLFTLYALAPPVDPDGLIHHLQAPKLFLEAGRFYPYPEMIFANYPSTIESLFTIGMAFGSDTFAKLIHLTYGGVLLLAVFASGRRYLGSNGGWIAVAILMGMPIVPVWASLAYIDMGWTLYEILAVLAILLWSERDEFKWLLASGIFTGLAMGSKYLAVGGLLVIGVWVLWHSRRKNKKTVLVSGFTFGAIALLVASPWYLKNWLWLGNPVYPYFSSVVERPLATQRIFGFWDYVILPWHLYINRKLFVGVHGSMEFLSPLFLLAFFVPFIKKPRPITWLAIITLLRYLVWVVTSHVRIRYGLPIIPLLSVLSASVVIYLVEQGKTQKFTRPIAAGLIGGLLLGSLLFSVLFFQAHFPLKVVFGFESKDSYLRQHLGDYAVIQYVRDNLSADARVFMMWDPRAYYCDERCIPDWYLDRWVQLVDPSYDVAMVESGLRQMGITHLIWDIQSAEYKVMHDLEGPQRAALDFFYHEFQPACTKVINESEQAILYEFTCR